MFKIGVKLLQHKDVMKSMRNKSKSSTEYCLDSVRQFDYENFVCTLLLKNTSRSCALAVRGLNVEIARVAEQVSQPNIGLMRLKFWEETIDKCFTKDPKLVPHHPVAVEIYKALICRDLTKRYFKTLINSRVQHFNLNGFKNLEAMEQYAEQSVSNVYYLILEGCGVKNVNADHAASHLGKAQGIVQHLRSVPQISRLNFLPLPQDILVKNGVSQEEILRGKSSQKFNDCTYEIASRAHQHLVKVRTLLESVPKEGRTALLSLVFIKDYLDKLQHADYDVFNPRLQHRSWKLLPRLWYTNFKINL